MRHLIVPAEIQKAIDQGAALALSVSGGKDGEAMANAVVHYIRSTGRTNEMFLVHADLGRMEWKESKPHCEKLAKRLGLPLFVVHAREGGLMARLRARMNSKPTNDKGEPAPFWPSSSNRYCTSDEKRNPIDKLLRRYQFVISVEGIRGEESNERQKKAVCSVRKQITSTAYNGTIQDVIDGKRLALTWNAIHDWKIGDVWDVYGHTSEELQFRQELYAAGDTVTALRGWEFSPVYVYGNERVSCQICLPFGSVNDIRNGIKHEGGHELAKELAEMEVESGFTFRPGLSINAFIEKPNTLHNEPQAHPHTPEG